MPSIGEILTRVVQWWKILQRGWQQWRMRHRGEGERLHKCAVQRQWIQPPGRHQWGEPGRTGIHRIQGVLFAGRRTKITPFTDNEGNVYAPYGLWSDQHNYRPGTRKIKKCVCIVIAITVVVLCSVLTDNLTVRREERRKENGTKHGVNTPLTMARSWSRPSRRFPGTTTIRRMTCSTWRHWWTSTATQNSCGRPTGGGKCQQICHTHFCRFDTNMSYNYRKDESKLWQIIAGYEALLLTAFTNEDKAEDDKVEKLTIWKQVLSTSEFYKNKSWHAKQNKRTRLHQLQRFQDDDPGGRGKEDTASAGNTTSSNLKGPPPPEAVNLSMPTVV